MTTLSFHFFVTKKYGKSDISADISAYDLLIMKHSIMLGQRLRVHAESPLTSLSHHSATEWTILHRASYRHRSPHLRAHTRRKNARMAITSPRASSPSSRVSAQKTYDMYPRTRFFLQVCVVPLVVCSLSDLNSTFPAQMLSQMTE